MQDGDGGEITPPSAEEDKADRTAAARDAEEPESVVPADADTTADAEPERGSAGGGEGPLPGTGEAQGSGSSGDAWDAGDAEVSGASATAFQDSGSFFRDRVARNLAEEHGLRLDENGYLVHIEEQSSDGAEHGRDAEAADEPPLGRPDDSAGPARAEGPDSASAPDAADSDFQPSTAPFPVAEEFDDDFDDGAPSAPAAGPSGADSDADAAGSEPGGQHWTPMREGPPAGPPPAPEQPSAMVPFPESPFGDFRPPAPPPAPDPQQTATGMPVGGPGAAGMAPPPVPPGGFAGPPGQGGGPGGPAVPPGQGPPLGPGEPEEPEAAASAASIGSAAAAPAKAAEAKRKPGKQRKAKRKRPLWFRLVRAALITVFGVLLLGVGAFGVAYAMIEVPDGAQEGVTDQGSTFYYSDGETAFVENWGVDREPVELDEVPEVVQDAVLAAEQHRFWEERGVSITGTARAIWVTVSSRITGAEETQGGSTITQQMVRNYYEGLSQEQTMSRKLQEIIIALKVDQQQDKEWILEQYLNTIYFGRGAEGIQAAAQAYFDKDVDELTAGEAAYIASVIQQPDRFGQIDEEYQEGRGTLEARWGAVVDRMVTEDWLSGEELSAAESGEMELPTAESATRDDQLRGHDGYMWQQAMDELDGLGITEEMVQKNGYDIVTTFDQDLMQVAQEAVEEVVPVGDLPDGVEAGLTAIDPATGEVVAFYGGPGYEEQAYDSAFRGTAQTGSSFKPFVLAAALEQGYSLNTVVDASSPQVFEGSTVQNSGGGNYPRVNLVDATARSVNTGYINLALQTGLDNVVATAYDLGIPEGRITEDQALAPTLALGVADSATADQAAAFATFANGGEHVETHVVRSVMDREGEEQRPEPERTQAVSEATAADVTHALQRVVSSGTGTRASLPDGRPVAGKTGTTDSSVAAWFVGYTPQMAAAVGVYNGDNQPFSVPGYGSLSGGTMPADLWRTFMSRAMEGEEVQQFPGPSGQGTTHDWGGAEPTPSPDEDDDEEPDQTPEAPVEPPPPDDDQEILPVEPGGEGEGEGEGEGDEGEEFTLSPGTAANRGRDLS